MPLTLYGGRVQAGFPSPADDFAEGRLDLNEHLVRRPAATFMVRVDGESMKGAGIHSGDLLVVDRSLEARPGDIVVAAVDGELTVKRLRRRRGRLVLAPENPAFPVIEIADGSDCTVWGVVAGVVRRLQRR